MSHHNNLNNITLRFYNTVTNNGTVVTGKYFIAEPIKPIPNSNNIVLYLDPNQTPKTDDGFHLPIKVILNHEQFKLCTISSQDAYYYLVINPTTYAGKLYLNCSIFGTSAAPLTIAHQYIMTAMFHNISNTAGQLCYLPYLLPDGVSNYYHKSSVISNQQKKQLIFKQLQHCQSHNNNRYWQVLQLNFYFLASEQPSKLIDFLQHFKQDLAKQDIVLEQIIFFTSAETIMNIPQWHDNEKLSSLCHLKIFDRTVSDQRLYSTNSTAVKNILNQLGFAEQLAVYHQSSNLNQQLDYKIGKYSTATIIQPIKQLSSSEIRHKINTGDASYIADVMGGKAIGDYIQANKLFIK